MPIMRCRLMRFLLASTCVASMVYCSAVRGDDPPASTPSQKKDEPKGRVADPAQNKKVQKLSEDQESQALGFARSQHPELADLLERLKKNDQKEYGRALLDLHRSQDRISRLADKNPERFGLEMALWRTESRIRLLAAQLAMGRDETQETALKPLLAERRELKMQLLQLDRSKAVERVAVLDRQLQALQSNPDAQDEQELNKLKQAAAKQKKAAKSTKKKIKEAVAPETSPTKDQKAKKPGKTNKDTPKPEQSKTEVAPSK